MAKIAFDYEPENVKTASTRWAWGEDTREPREPEFRDTPTDGDTPRLLVDVRMLSIDTPEVHYPSVAPSAYDDLLNSFASNMPSTFPTGLQKHLAKRLRNQAGSYHEEQGHKATEFLIQLGRERLTRIGKRGQKLVDRKVFTMVSEEPFDHYGRMLAYVNGYYEKKELAALPASKRKTFNLALLESGWASSMIIYPNIPKKKDLLLMRKAVRKARQRRIGIWQNAGRVLLAFELRFCVRAAKKQGDWEDEPGRYCADMITGNLYSPGEYYRVQPEDSLWFWPEDLGDALRLGLKPQWQ